MSEQYTLDDLDYIWMDDGLACFFGDVDNICDIVESLGFNIYYVVANQTEEIKVTSTSSVGSTVAYNNSNKTATVTPTTTSKIVNTAKIFKVVNNFVGRSVTLAEPGFLSDQFVSMEEQCLYNMPAIPHILIEKLDQFFRLVDAQHGTESIVMLTYDMDKQGPDGWGILVPDQTNTSVHCNYDPDSIAKIKPDNVMIVGSVHSHPGMAAYASGTDHADQADFDGIHITFGWQKSVNNGATQYYIELQMSGKTYKLDPQDVFEDYIIDKAPDPEVVGWTDKVKKANPPIQWGAPTSAPLRSPTHHQTTTTTPDYTAAGTPRSKNSQYIKYPPHISALIDEQPKLDMDSIVLCQVHDGDDPTYAICPGCLSSISYYVVYANNSCDICDIPLCEENTTADQMIWNIVDYCKERNIPTDCALYLYDKDFNGQVMLLKLTPTTINDYVDSQWDAIDNPTKSTSVTPTLCCSSPPSECFCEQQVLAYDSIDFDNFIGSVNVYNSSTCSSCMNYYDIACPSYREQVVDFVQNAKTRKQIDYEGSITGVDCTFYNSYLDPIDTAEDIH